MYNSARVARYRKCKIRIYVFMYEMKFVMINYWSCLNGQYFLICSITWWRCLNIFPQFGHGTLGAFPHSYLTWRSREHFCVYFRPHLHKYCNLCTATRLARARRRRGDWKFFVSNGSHSEKKRKKICKNCPVQRVCPFIGKRVECGSDKYFTIYRAHWRLINWPIVTEAYNYSTSTFNRCDIK